MKTIKKKSTEKNSTELEIKAVSLHPGEIIAPTGAITVVFNEPVDAKSAQAGFRIIPDVRGDVTLSDDNTKATWVPISPMERGGYALVLEDFMDKNRSKTVQRKIIQFVVPSNFPHFAKIGDGHAVMSLSKTKLPLLKEQFSVAKVMDPKTNKFSQITLDEKGNKVDFNEVLKKHQKMYLEKYGKIHPSLHEKIAKLKDREKMPVAIWAAIEDEKLDKTKLETETPKNKRKWLVRHSKKLYEANSKLGNLIADKIAVKPKRVSKLAPVLLYELTKVQVQKIAELKEVGRIFLYERRGVADLQDSLEASSAAYVVDTLGYDGTNVRVGVWEGGADITTNLSIEAEYDTTPATTSWHTRVVTAIIKNTQPNAPHGYAPDCRIYAANDYDVEALEWAVKDQNCTVINQSFHRSAESSSGGLSFDDMYKDYLVLHAPYPTIIQAAGNYFPTDTDPTPGGTVNEFVNHKGYNSLTVGNHTDDSSAMSGDSVFRNPNSSHGDRELPEICANGTVVITAGTWGSGTSFSSPAVAGTAALLQEVNPTLSIWPEGIRAILLAAASRNISGNTWLQDIQSGVDALDGSGALNTSESVQIALTRKPRNNTGVPRGWDVGVLNADDFDAQGYSKFIYRVKAPLWPSWWPLRMVKIALAWDSKVAPNNSGAYDDELTLDYDLLVFDGNTVVASSMTWDNSYEIVEFAGTPGKTYDIKIRKFSGNDWSYYGIAWRVRSLIWYLEVKPFLRSLNYFQRV